MFIVTLTYIRPIEEIDALLPAHLDWLKRGYAAGVLVASGRKVPRDGGVILARAADRGALDALIAEDPFARGGVARYDVTEFTPTMTAPGLEALRETAH